MLFQDFTLKHHLAFCDFCAKYSKALLTCRPYERLKRSCLFQPQTFDLKQPVADRIGEDLLVFDKWTQRVLLLSFTKAGLQWRESGKINAEQRFGVACAVLKSECC